MSERTLTAGTQFDTAISVWSANGSDLSLVLRPESFTCMEEDEDHFIEIEFDRIDEFCEILQKLKEEQDSGN